MLNGSTAEVATLQAEVAQLRAQAVALRERCAWLQAAVAPFPGDAALVLDTFLYCRAATSAAPERLGRTSENITGTALAAMLPPAAAAQILPACAAALEGASNMVAVSLAGQPCLVDIDPIANSPDGQPGVLLVIHDGAPLPDGRCVSAPPRAENAARLLPRLITALVAHAPVGIQLYDRDGASLMMNEAQRRLLSLLDTSHNVDSLHALSDPFMIASGSTAIYARAYAGEVVHTPDQSLDLTPAPDRWHAAPRRIWFNHYLVPIRDNEGQVVAVASFVEDQTARKEAENEVRQLNAELEQLVRQRTAQLAATVGRLEREVAERRRADERLAFLLSASPAVLFTARAEGDYGATFVSDNATSIIGHRPEDFTSDSTFWRRHIHPDDAPDVFARIARLPAEGCSTQEYRFRHADGSYHWMRADVRLVRDPDGRPVEVVGTWLDITPQRQAELELRISEDRYRLIAEHTGDLIALLDHQGRYVYASPSYGTVLGYEPAALLNTDSFALLHPDDHGTARAVCWPLPTPHGSRATLRFRHASEDWRWIEVQGSTITHPEGDYLVWTGRDVTDRRRLEAQLLQAQKMEAIGRLAGGVAHDFNNLLVVMLGCADLAQASLEEGHPAMADLREIRYAAERASLLTRQLLTFARRQASAPQLLDLNDVVSSARSMLYHLIPETITLTVALAPDLWPVRADLPQLEQVLINLVINARDAMPAGGEITITTANLMLTVDHGRMLPPGAYVCLSVIDNGTGMSPEVRSRAFEPFFTTKAAGYGTGLGLATSYGIVTQYGGTIDLDSAEGIGTCVAVYLPRAGNAPDQPPEPGAPRAAV